MRWKEVVTSHCDDRDSKESGDDQSARYSEELSTSSRDEVDVPVNCKEASSHPLIINDAGLQLPHRDQLQVRASNELSGLPMRRLSTTEDVITDELPI